MMFWDDLGEVIAHFQVFFGENGLVTKYAEEGGDFMVLSITEAKTSMLVTYFESIYEFITERAI